MSLLRFSVSVCSIVGMLNASAGETVTVTVAPELWDRPRSGHGLLEQPAVKQAVGAYLAQPGARLIIHHAAHQESLLQAEELRAWLVAFAVEAERVMLRSGLPTGEPLKIEIVSTP